VEGTTKQVLKRAFGKTLPFSTAPPSAPPWKKAQLVHPMHLINCHRRRTIRGSTATTTSIQPVALDSADLVDKTARLSSSRPVLLRRTALRSARQASAESCTYLANAAAGFLKAYDDRVRRVRRSERRRHPVRALSRARARRRIARTRCSKRGKFAKECAPFSQTG
jgi:hypothetical protein